MRFRFSVIACVILAAHGAVRAQGTIPPGCDARLQKAGARHDTSAYRVRGTTTKWCEGVLVRQEVGNIELRLRAFTQSVAPVDTATLRKIDTLLVEWTAPPGMVVHIVARQSTDALADFYQLDVEVPTPANGRGTWRWPTEVIKRARMWPLPVEDAGGDLPPVVSVQAVGRMRANQTDSVYVPVRIVPSADTVAKPQAGPPVFRITMTAKERVTVRRPSLFRLADDGSTAPIALARRCPAVTGGAVGGDPVTIPVCMPADAPSGLYLVALSAAGNAAMIKATGVRFYYRAPSR